MVWFMIFLYLEDPGRCVFAALFYQHLTCKHFPRKHMQTYACEADAGGRRPKWTQGTSRGTVEKATTFTWFRNGNILGTFEVQVLHLSMHLPELRPQHLFCKLQQTHNAQDRSSQMPCPHGPTTVHPTSASASLRHWSKPPRVGWKAVPVNSSTLKLAAIFGFRVFQTVFQTVGFLKAVAIFFSLSLEYSASKCKSKGFKWCLWVSLGVSKWCGCFFWHTDLGNVWSLSQGQH